MKKVVILQHRLLHYRMNFFDRLRKGCEAKGIQLHLVHGQPTQREREKRDVGTLPWADVVVNRYISIGSKDVLWQPFPAHHHDADLVIIMQENRLLSNYPWLFLRGLHKSKLGYWGHGRNFQAHHPAGLLEKWKQFLLGRVDWWFAYTDMTKDILLSNGYPAERITVLDNAIDNEGFLADLASITDTRLSELRNELGLPDDAHVGLFCGSLYPDKRLDYMVAAADKIQASQPHFHLVVIGDGPSVSVIKEATVSRPWLHWVGVRKGIDKAAYFRLAHIVLNPGAVGLHVLDSFCAGVPMVTTFTARHGPEIAYLKDGENGLVVKGGVDDYADAIIGLLLNPSYYMQLKAGALNGSKRYTLQNMVDSFANGIERCLIMDKKF
ncbi:glycosyltransferase family 4 protein [Methylicorpusculum oleiharenae]|uniref:glycosyltransferase family 4 protein n=1 Tax=Methylicorpusculum oleiharenae TaxID=1338687 RepID=UPI0013592C35|nr:glycosyltransferase family 4 protein [Methylicorpusculum oleiharenae]MCD2448862.1 glycosyltransferase family 4 protein [Methylicorpusculum oleiharenae]